MTPTEKLWLAERHRDPEAWEAWIYNPASGIEDPHWVFAQNLMQCMKEYETRSGSDCGTYLNRAQREAKREATRKLDEISRKTAFDAARNAIREVGLNGDLANDAVVEMAALAKGREASAASQPTSGAPV